MFQRRCGLPQVSYLADSSMYAHFLFEAFDTNKNGSVSFEVSATLLSASLQRLKQKTCCEVKLKFVLTHINVYFL